jgi:isopenicillin N synthase-like dioxygenase
MSSSQIPVVDVSGPAESVAAELDEVFRTIGFVQIVGHGVDPGLHHAVYEAAAPLWALSDADAASLASPHPFRGLVTERRDDGARLVQRFQVNHYESPADARAAGVPADASDWFVPNVWPDLPELVAAYAALFPATRALGNRLMRLFALALGIGTDGFAGMFDRDVSYCAVHDYPAAPGAFPGETRVPQHSDSGLLTILHQRGDYEGLELGTATGELVTVPVIDDALVVNVGDLMGRWTNDHWKATPHRVISGSPGESRISIATHYLPNIDATIAPLSTCVSAGGPRYEPVTPYSWERRYFDKPSLVLRLEDGPAVSV